MPSAIDEFLARVEPAKRKPTLKYAGRPFLGFAARAQHISIYPYSGSVIAALGGRLAGYACSKSAIRVPLDRPISKRLLHEIIACRLEAVRAETKKAR
jgi:uncharacterized protein YdhG (YjbR/CyaY superfamily)